MNHIHREIPAEVKIMKEARYETNIFKQEDTTVYQWQPSKNDC